MAAVSTPQPTSRETPQWLVWLVLGLIFVAPGQLAYARDPKHGPFIGLADLLAVLVCAVWLLGSWRSAAWRGWTWPPKPVWAWLAVAVVSGIGAESLRSALQEIVQMALYFGAVYMLFVHVLSTRERQRQALWALMAGTGLAVLVALLQYLRAADPMSVKALFQSRNAYGACLSMTLPLAFGIILWTKSRWERLAALVLLVLGAVTIIAPPLVWILLAVLVVLALQRSRPRTALYYALGAIVLCVLSAAYLPLNRLAWQELTNPYEQGPIYKLMVDSGSDATQPGNEKRPVIVKKRWLEWMPALNMMAQNFWLGLGPGNYQTNIGQPEYYGFLPNVKKSEPDTANLYLVVGSTMGFAGLVCLVWYMGHFIRLASRLRKQAQDASQQVLATGLLGVALAIPLVNLFSSLFVRGTALVWALAYALIIVQLSNDGASGAGE